MVGAPYFTSKMAKADRKEDERDREREIEREKKKLFDNILLVF